MANGSRQPMKFTKYCEQIDSWKDFYANNLRKQYLETKNSFDQWETSTIYQIQQHATAQRRLLNDFYNEKVQQINQTFQRIAGERRKFEAEKKNAELEKLVQRCEALKFQLGDKYFHEKTIVHPYLETSRQLTERPSNKLNGSNRKEQHVSAMTLSNGGDVIGGMRHETLESSYEMIDSSAFQEKYVLSLISDFSIRSRLVV